MPPAATSPLAAAPAAGDDAACFHCALPLPRGRALSADVDGEPRPVCCAGCKAAAESIAAAGLAAYYEWRDRPAPTPEPMGAAEREAFGVWDRPAVQRGVVARGDDGLARATLVLDRVECAACTWLIERTLARLDGVREVALNYASRRAEVTFDPAAIGLGRVLAEVARLGYRAHPYSPDREEAVHEAERRARLKGLGVAGVLGAQVMMLSVALYAGEWYGIEPAYRALFRWTALALTVPVLAYAARPFFAGAARALAAGRVDMDVPVSLGLAIAFAGSVHATVTGSGHVYYDSVTMFVFFLLLARYLELMARRRGARAVHALARAAPAVATRIVDDGEGERRAEPVPAAELVAGDVVVVRPGEAVPADGPVIAGASGVAEALLSGESRPVAKRAGDRVLAGSINQESPIEVRVEAAGDDTVLAHVVALASRAALDRPRAARVADAIAGWFVAGVLVVAAAVAAYWWSEDPSRWIPITVAVLVITCPCALSLATPAAFTAATEALARRGVLVTRGDAIETLARARRVVLDKTGTLTRGAPALRAVEPLRDADAARCLAIAAALERTSEHPIARAVLAAAPADEGRAARDVESVPGEGVSGVVDGRRYRLGTPAFAGAPGADGAGDDTVVVLADDAGPLARLLVEDDLRDGAPALVAALAAGGRAPSLLSGDRPRVVARVAAALGIDAAEGGLRPAEKLDRIRALQARGETVAMVGDGVNDAPVLAGADVSVAMGGGAAAAKVAADVVLVRDDLAAIADAFDVARRTRAVVAQNLAWALGYNVVALPAAAAGLVAPWMAAIGMSASSLVVVANALRLRRPGPRR